MDFARSLSEICVAFMLSQRGYDKSSNACVTVLGEILGEYMLRLAAECKSQAELSERSEVSLLDIIVAFEAYGVDNLREFLSAGFPRLEPSHFPLSITTDSDLRH
jgi:hypothetical protein